MLASRATLPQKQRQQRRWKHEGEKGGGEEDERKEESGWLERAGRQREQDEKCNYDFEKWAKPPLREDEHFRTGFGLERYLEFLD